MWQILFTCTKSCSSTTIRIWDLSSFHRPLIKSYDTEADLASKLPENVVRVYRNLLQPDQEMAGLCGIIISRGLDVCAEKCGADDYYDRTRRHWNGYVSTDALELIRNARNSEVAVLFL